MDEESYGKYLEGSAKNKKLTTWKKENGKWTKKAKLSSLAMFKASFQKQVTRIIIENSC